MALDLPIQCGYGLSGRWRRGTEVACDAICRCCTSRYRQLR